MNNVPNMIFTKDASYLKDMFNWNIIALKKFNVYNEYINDMEKNGSDISAAAEGAFNG